jgi:hypothetical protein
MTIKEVKRHEMKLEVNVTAQDIQTGEGCSAARCMEKIAIERALNNLEPGDHKVRIAAQGIKFNFRGYRWEAKTPKAALKNLILFDENYMALKGKKRLTELHVINPHSYRVTAIRCTKIAPMSPARQEQINRARRKREAEGRRDRRDYPTIRDRIVGADIGHG